MKEFIFDNLRFELLDEEIIHIEKATSAGFSNENTLFIAEKENLTKSEFFVQDNGDYFTLFMNEYYAVLFKGQGLKGFKIYDKYGSILYKYSKKMNSGELPHPAKTPAIFALFDDPRVTLPKHGYSIESFKNNEELKVENNVIDFYLLLAKGQASDLRRLYVKLTGRSEFVRFKTLGFWNSRYYKYTEETAKKMILDHKEHDIPLDNMVIDTDWRKANDIGIGYDIATDLFPDMKRFFKFAHKNDVEIMFNDHPEPYKDAKNVFDEKEVAFREEKLQGILKLGLDYWWYDRNWSTHLNSIDKFIRPETMGDYLFSDITKHYFQKEAKSETVYKRPIIMANVNNVLNGTYEGILDSASHRYSIQWTGDIQSSLNALNTEVKSLIKGCANEITYINSDIGGQVGNPTKSEYIRWMQYGAFSPIFRVHCTNCVTRFREPWNYDEETLNISRDYINLRYRLLPLLYTKAFDNYECGEPLFKDLAFNYHDKKALNNTSEYLLANDILVSPFSYPEMSIVKKVNFVGKVKASYFNNLSFEGKPVATKTFDDLNLSYIGEAPCKEVGPYNYTVRYEFKLKFNKDTNLFVASDDGSTVYIDGKLVHEDSSSHAVTPADLGIISKNEVHDIRIDYYQYTGAAQIYLGEVPASKAVKKAYLPSDQWIDAFTGKVYEGETTVKKDEKNLREMPLFIRGGSIIPLVKEASRANKLDYSKLTLDYYPSFINEDHQALYEDDKVTTAYKMGEYRKTYLDSYFNKEENALTIHLSKAIGNFNNEISERDIILRLNLLNNVKDIKKVTINGEEVEFKLNKKNSNLMPLSFGEVSNIFDTISIKFKENISEEYFIKFHL